jgi:nicotinate-nucleotide adenylyltransferase
LFADLGDEEVSWSVLASSDEGRCGGSLRERDQLGGFGRGIAANRRSVTTYSRRPVGTELPNDSFEQHSVAPRSIVGSALEKRFDGREGIDPRVGEGVDDEKLLHGRAVDLTDLTDEQLDQGGVGEDDRELVDGDVHAALEHVDPDDVGTERSDPRRHESERPGAVREPNTNPKLDAGGLDRSRDVGRVVHTRHTMGMPARNRTSKTDRRRVGLFGGTFDPPHNGHVMIAAQSVYSLGLDRLHVTVANDPYSKRDAVSTLPDDRLALARAAFSHLEHVVVDDRELLRGGPSYTVDTVESMLAEDPVVDVVVIVGADAAAGLPRWHRASDLSRLVEIAVVGRSGDETVLIAGFRCVKIDLIRVDVASSEIRRRVAHQEPIDGLVPPAVVRELRERRLYTGFR